MDHSSTSFFLSRPPSSAPRRDKMVRGNSGWSRLVKNPILLVLVLLFAVSGCDLLSCSCEQGVEGLGACTHTNTCQRTQIDAWPMLVADAGKKCLESHHIHPSKHAFARRVCVTRGARKRPACFIVGTQCMTDGGNRCKVMIYQFSFTLVCFLYAQVRLEASASDSEWFLPCVGCSLLIQILEELSCNYAKTHLVVGHLCIKPTLS